MLAKANANLLIQKYGFTKPQDIQLENLIYAENLFIKEDFLHSYEGRLVFNHTYGLITLNKSISEQRQKNFVLAHELGHFINERKDSIFSTGQNYQSIHCGFAELYNSNYNNIREKNANEFAGELLMHEPWFISFTAKTKFGAGLILEIADHFNVSLTAAALKYSLIGPRECAVVFCRDGSVEWSSINKAFKYQFIRSKSKVASLSYAHDFFSGKPVPSAPEEIPAEAWFSECNLNIKDLLLEFCFPMPNYNSVLVVVWMK
ncbi:MAG: ImmA/IrrE family metallo-endopeptidase [Ignavibacteria bacterium]|nr:ImmA/IrrE family metallo-endopeptidase [Ignavibacteria bacterium]